MTNQYVCQLSEAEQLKIKAQLTTILDKNGCTPEELDKWVQVGMDSKVCDLGLGAGLGLKKELYVCIEDLVANNVAQSDIGGDIPDMSLTFESKTQGQQIVDPFTSECRRWKVDPIDYYKEDFLNSELFGKFDVRLLTGCGCGFSFRDNPHHFEGDKLTPDILVIKTRCPSCEATYLNVFKIDSLQPMDDCKSPTEAKRLKEIANQLSKIAQEFHSLFDISDGGEYSTSIDLARICNELENESVRIREEIGEF